MKNTRRIARLLTGLALLCLGLGAAPTRSGAQTQDRMNADALADFKRTDRALSVVYNHVAQRLPAVTSRKLAAAEKAWLAFRDAEAHFSASTKVEGGSLYPTAFNDARTDLTRQRIKRLKKISLSNALAPQSFTSLSPTTIPGQ